MLKKFYHWFHKKISKSEERGEYSAGYWQNMVRATALDLCKRNTGSIFEVGCGEGLFLAKLAQESQNLKIFGIDIWKDILLRAKRRFENNRINSVGLVQADAVDIPFKDNCFDTVVCINVFFNLPLEEIFHKSFQEIARVCKKGGRVIFDIRNSMNPFLYAKYKLAKYYDETTRDLPLRTYRLSKVTSDLEKQNFKIINRINIGFPKNNLAPIFIVVARKKQ